MKKFIPTRAARVVFALMMMFFGVNHLMFATNMAGMINGWPLAEVLIYLSGVCLLLAGVSFIIGKMVTLSGYLLALLLIIIAFGVHAMNFGAQDMMMKQMAMTNFVKDLAIAMGAISFANQAES